MDDSNSVVQLPTDLRTGKSDPFARLINWMMDVSWLATRVFPREGLHTVDLPLPLTPMTLDANSRYRQPESERLAYAIAMVWSRKAIMLQAA